MSERSPRRLHLWRERLLRVATLLTLAAVVACGQATTSRGEGELQATDVVGKVLEFEVASIRPNKSGTTAFRLAFTADGVRIENASMLMIVRAAYGMFNSLDDKFYGVPGWAKAERFDIEAKVNDADAAEFQKLNFEKRQFMVQALLGDRFKLQAHHETKEQPVYSLVIAKNGSKLQESKPVEGSDPGGTMKRKPGQIAAQNIVISQLVTVLTQTLGRTVQDKTGLKGKYDLTLDWTADEEGTPLSKAADLSEQASTPSGPSIFTAIQEQLGLKLEAARGPVEVLVIDHVERPSEN